ncbi:MAG: DUF3341 domain-containing protein [Flavobacteriales bacterium]|nr:DUF3341 domain-containing protein [Flavobacteriales bacterium]
MSKIYGLYTDDDILKHGAKYMVDQGLHISDVYSPFPIHGIEKVIGMKWTRLAICAFIYGCIGLSLALLGIWYFMISDWPMNIGGKPSFSLLENLPSFIPVTFEFTVFCTAHGMAITYLIRNWTFPGAIARNPDPRTTDDHFAVEIDPHMNHNFDKDQISKYLKDTGAVEIFEK